VKLAAVLRAAERQLAEAGIDDPSLDARWLAEHALGIDRAAMPGRQERTLSGDEARRIESLISRRAAHEPVARIVGEREFWSLSFGLNEATLEPRPDSETLVEVALKYLRGRAAPRLLDLGTGTGCLLLACLHEIPGAAGLGIDIAPRAVEQARINAENLGLAERAAFKTGNWCEGLAEKFDAILSNPPYIPSSEIPGLMPEVRAHDPVLALDGGKDGLAACRLLVPSIAQFLKPDGFAIFEVGRGQADDVAALCLKAGLAEISKHKDLNGIERCVAARRAATP
jgi:release factor glutamine methyltransferase